LYIFNISSYFYKKKIIKSILYIFLFKTFPEIGQYFLKKQIRPILFRIKKFHEILCINPQLMSKIYHATNYQKIKLSHLISNIQQIKIYASPEFREININNLFFSIKIIHI